MGFKDNLARYKCRHTFSPISSRHFNRLDCKPRTFRSEHSMGNSDQLVLQRLLKEISDRMTGALDVWTLVSLGHIDNFGSDDFLHKNADILRSLVLVFRTIATKNQGQTNDG